MIHTQGLFTPDREPHPAVAEAKFLQQPVEICSLSGKDLNRIEVDVSTDQTALVKLRVKNRYSFRDLSNLSWSWTLTCNKRLEPVGTGQFELPSPSKAVDEVILKLDGALANALEIERMYAAGRVRYYLTVHGSLASKTHWAPSGHEVVTRQLEAVIRFPKSVQLSLTRENQATASMSSFTIDTDNSTISVFEKGSKKAFIELEKTTGALVLFAPYGRNLLCGASAPNFTRAATDNDKGGMELLLDFFLISGIQGLYESVMGRDEFSYDNRWKSTGLSECNPPVITCDRWDIPTNEAPGSEGLSVKAFCNVRSASSSAIILKVVIQYAVMIDKRLQISCRVDPQQSLHSIPTLPRVGMNFQLDQTLSKITYCGRGPHENYPDRKASARMGVYATTPHDMCYLKYIVPSENGSRSDCEWVSFVNQTGDGLSISSRKCINSIPNFSCSAQLHSAHELEEATHTCDLETRETGPIHVNIDHRLMGVGGDNSWFPVVYPEFRVKPSSYSFEVWLRPLKRGDDPSLVICD